MGPKPSKKTSKRSSKASSTKNIPAQIPSDLSEGLLLTRTTGSQVFTSAPSSPVLPVLNAAPSAPPVAAFASDESATAVPNDSGDEDEEVTQFRFNAHRDIILLQEVMSLTPFRAAHGQVEAKWAEVADHVNVALDVDGAAVTAKSARKRFNFLVKKMRADEADSLRKSGVEEDFDERERLLTDIIALVSILLFNFSILTFCHGVA